MELLIIGSIVTFLYLKNKSKTISKDEIIESKKEVKELKKDIPMIPFTFAKKNSNDYFNPAVQSMAGNIVNIFKSEILGFSFNPLMIAGSITGMTSGQTDFASPYAGYVQAVGNLIPIPLLGTVLGGFTDALSGARKKNLKKLQNQINPIRLNAEKRLNEIIDYLKIPKPEYTKEKEMIIWSNKIIAFCEKNNLFSDYSHPIDGVIGVYTYGEKFLFDRMLTFTFSSYDGIYAFLIDKIYLGNAPISSLTNDEKIYFDYLIDKVRNSLFSPSMQEGYFDDELSGITLPKKLIDYVKNNPKPIHN